MSKNDITGDSIRSKGFFSEQGEKNFDLIFGKKKSRMDVVGQNGNDGLAYTIDKDWDEMTPVGQEILAEYELNKSTGDVEKRFKDGVGKPNGEQFDE